MSLPFAHVSTSFLIFSVEESSSSAVSVEKTLPDTEDRRLWEEVEVEVELELEDEEAYADEADGDGVEENALEFEEYEYE